MISARIHEYAYHAVLARDPGYATGWDAIYQD